MPTAPVHSLPQYIQLSSDAKMPHEAVIAKITRFVIRSHVANVFGGEKQCTDILFRGMLSASRCIHTRPRDLINAARML